MFTINHQLIAYINSIESEPANYPVIAGDDEHAAPTSSSPILPFNIDWSNVVLAGGAVSRHVFGMGHTNDYDLFLYGLATQEQYDAKINQLIATLASPSSQIIKSDNVVRVDNIDIVLINYDNPQQILDSFDINAAMFGYDGKQIFTNVHGLTFLRNRRLVIQFDKMSGAYACRLYKYHQRGFALELTGYTGTTEEIHLGNDKVGILAVHCGYLSLRSSDLSAYSIVNANINKLIYLSEQKVIQIKSFNPLWLSVQIDSITERLPDSIIGRTKIEVHHMVKKIYLEYQPTYMMRDPSNHTTRFNPVHMTAAEYYH